MEKKLVVMVALARGQYSTGMSYLVLYIHHNRLAARLVDSYLSYIIDIIVPLFIL